MSYNLIVTQEAIKEATDAYAFHKQIGQELADRFDLTLDASFKEITLTPTAYQIRKKNYRHLILRPFRYRMVYTIIGQDVVVFQIRHTSRRVSREFGP
ncbi:MAG: type II toxin-antitoxin system RelE/ParE family toxin [Bacteroidota bacterium]|nr:type II toxin-antitoxin system RelE/ParE family toxin [Bacteroidota bacterium]